MNDDKKEKDKKSAGASASRSKARKKDASRSKASRKKKDRKKGAGPVEEVVPLKVTGKWFNIGQTRQGDRDKVPNELPFHYGKGREEKVQITLTEEEIEEDLKAMGVNKGCWIWLEKAGASYSN